MERKGLEAWTGERFDASGIVLNLPLLERIWKEIKGESHLRIVEPDE